MHHASKQARNNTTRRYKHTNASMSSTEAFIIAKVEEEKNNKEMKRQHRDPHHPASTLATNLDFALLIHVKTTTKAVRSMSSSSNRIEWRGSGSPPGLREERKGEVKPSREEEREVNE
jgi:hypothetical protein